jgi:hypothetical protein
MTVYNNINQVPAPTGNATTDTSNINTAMALGGITQFSAGHYVINSSINAIPSGAFLRGVGMGGYGSPVGEVSDSNQTHISMAASQSAHMLHLPVGNASVTIEDLYLDGNKNNNSGWNIIQADDVTGSDEQLNLVLNRVHLEAASNYGIYIGQGRRDVKANRIVVLYSASHNLLIKGSDTVWESSAFGSAGNNNVEIQAVVTRFNFNDVWGAANAGIVVMTDITGVVISGNGIDRNGKQGIYLNSGVDACRISNNVLHSNSQLSDNGYAHIDVETLKSGVSIDGNVTMLDGGMTNIASYMIYLGTIGGVKAAPYIGAGNYVVDGSTHHNGVINN